MKDSAPDKEPAERTRAVHRATNSSSLPSRTVQVPHVYGWSMRDNVPTPRSRKARPYSLRFHSRKVRASRLSPRALTNASTTPVSIRTDGLWTRPSCPRTVIERTERAST